MPTIYFKSFDGCYANKSEGEQIRQYFLKNGYMPVENATAADLVVYNTCAFDRNKENYSMRTISELKKEVRLGAELLVTGCLPGINQPRLKTQFKGKTVTPKTLDQLDQLFAHTVPFSQFRENHAEVKSHSTIKLIKVATGCLGNCSYCGIRIAIGHIKSRPVEEIVSEFEEQYDQGYRHFAFASHDFGAYGQDIYTNCIELIRALPEKQRDYKVEIEWIDPNWLYKYLDGFVEMLKSGKLATYFFVSLQSGSDRILKLMRRHYSAEQVRHCLKRLNREVANFQPQIEFIVGFPTETGEDFQATLRLIDEFVFLRAEVYKFDPKPGTDAAKMQGQIPNDIKDQRYQDASHLIQNNHRRFRLMRKASYLGGGLSRHWLIQPIRLLVGVYEATILPLRLRLKR